MTSPDSEGLQAEAMVGASDRWAVDLTDCGRDDGVQVCETWEKADSFRQAYVAAFPACGRVGVIHQASPGTRLGYHDPAPYLEAEPSSPVVPSVGAVPVEVPEEIVDAAAMAIGCYSPEQYERWRHTSKGQQAHDRALAALQAAYPLIAVRVRAEADAAALERVGRVLDVVVAGNSRRTMATQQLMERIAADIYAALQADDALTDHDARVRAEERQRIAAEIRTHAGPLTSEGVYVGVSTWPADRAAGYTAAIDEILEEVIEPAAAGSAVPVATPTEPVDWCKGTPDQVAAARAEVEATEARYAAEQDGQR